jgi:hypothetical protein
LTQRFDFGLIFFSARVEAQVFIITDFVDGRSETKSRKGMLAEVASSSAGRCLWASEIKSPGLSRSGD